MFHIEPHKIFPGPTFPWLKGKEKEAYKDGHGDVLMRSPPTSCSFPSDMGDGWEDKGRSLITSFGVFFGTDCKSWEGWKRREGRGREGGDQKGFRDSSYYMH